MLQPGKYWPEFRKLAGRPELASDDRFDIAAKLIANTSQATPLVTEIMRGKTYAESGELLAATDGPWAAVQDAWDEANDETPARTTRTPQFAEHTDEVLRSLGCSEDDLIRLKIAGAAT
jgi:crotonobetainyl-CoA:carnitine CoA-transferase CaiB-like acyl-CoA transferase